MDDRAIGVFDSGVGGLAVLWALAELLPNERLVYHADTAHFPYGERSAGDVRALTLSAAERLLAEHDIKALVIACNTATSAALPDVRARCALPVVGIEPAIRPAVARSRTGRIGVLATRGTVEGSRLAALIEREAGGVEVVVAPAPELVEAIERGAAEDEALADLLSGALAPLRTADVDVVVLGCTHFAFVRGALQQLLGPDVAVLEPAAAVARQAVRVLAERNLLAPAAHHGSIVYTSSGDPDQFAAHAARLRSALYSPPPFPLPAGNGELPCDAERANAAAAIGEVIDPLPRWGRDRFAEGKPGLSSLVFLDATTVRPPSLSGKGPGVG